MSSKSHSQGPLIFAWGVRDHSTWHLVVALLALMGAMAGFFFIFRIVHPVTQRMPTTPQRVISLDPNDPAALALIHRAQDRSFALLSDESSILPLENSLLAFRPSFEGYEIKLRELPPPAASTKEPRLFTAATDVLPPVARRATPPATVPSKAKLRVVMSAALSKRQPTGTELPDIKLTQPSRVQFRVAVGSLGQIVTALPLSTVEDLDVMKQLQEAVNGLRFEPSTVRRIEWGEISFRWEPAVTP